MTTTTATTPTTTTTCTMLTPATRTPSLLPPTRAVLRAQVGDVIYIEANSGAVKRVGRCDAYATEFDLEAEEYVPLPKVGGVLGQGARGRGGRDCVQGEMRRLLLLMYYLMKCFCEHGVPC